MAVAAIAAIVVVAGSPAAAAAGVSPDWWEERSVDEREGIVNVYYGVSGKRAPYAGQSSVASGAITHLKDGTPQATRPKLATDVMKGASKTGILPPLKTWVPKLVKKSPVLYAAHVGLQAEYDFSQWLHARWSMNLTEAHGSIQVSQVKYYPEGHDIYFGAKSRGEYLLDGTIGGSSFTPMRWFESPCTFSGFSAPPEARMRTGVATTATCTYPIDVAPYSATAPVLVDYPYLTEDDLQLVDWPVIGPTGTPAADYSVSTWPAPSPAVVEPLLEEELESAANDGLRHHLLVALAAERILQNNPDAVAAGTLDTDRARRIADACVTNARVQPGTSSADCGRRGLPMFIGGRLDFPEATDHMIRALEYGLEHGAEWLKLRYYQRPDAERRWKQLYPETDDPFGVPRCVGTPVDHCDEFPFLKTEQGALKDSTGTPQATLPHLKLINGSENAGSGGRFGTMVLGCKMQLRRDHPDPQYGLGHFLVIPVPLAGLPTFYLCNGSNPA